MSHNANHQLSDAHLEEVAKLMGALSEVSRLKLLRELMAGSRTVSELMAATGMKQGNVSKHLGILLAVGVVSRRAEGGFARYELVGATVEQLCSLVCQWVEEGLDRRVRGLRNG
jgi:DNA-binding transcriptional ArsR family regulator